MRGLPASGPKRTKVVALGAAASLVLGAVLLTSVGSGALSLQGIKPPFGPKAFALSRSTVRHGVPSPSSSSPPSPTTTTPPTTMPTTAPAPPVAPASEASSPKAPPQAPPAVQTTTPSPSNARAISVTSADVPSGNSTAAGVARALIAAINSLSGGRYKIPATADNVTLLERWMANEGGLWADNPLNTSLDSSQYPHQITSGGQNTGIPIFPTMAAGVQATAKTLLDNGVYSHILTELRSGSASCVAFATAVIHSPWAASHYGYDPARFCQGVIPPARGIHKHHRRTAARVRSAAHPPHPQPVMRIHHKKQGAKRSS